MKIAESELESLRTEINGILTRYDVPMDDRTLVSERVEESIGRILSHQKRAFLSEVEKIREEIHSERGQVAKKLGAIHSAAKSQMGRKLLGAYQSGLQQGLSQTKGPGLLQVLLAVAVLGLAGFVVIQGLFRR